MTIRNILAVITLFLSIECFVLGLVFPILSTKQQVLGIVLKYQEVKILDSVRIFYEEQDYFLAFVIFIFTILFPVVKYIDLTIRFLGKKLRYNKICSVLQQLDKWSMLDVFLVALLLLNFKMNSNIIVMKLNAGTTFIALSVISRMISIYFYNNIKLKKI
jgi:paraquat-inducible protein A